MHCVSRSQNLLHRHGVEIKTTRKPGGAVDTHGARKQTLCVFVYEVDLVTQPAINREALKFREVYIGEVAVDDFRKNDRGELGTRTATLHADGLEKFRRNWVYLEGGLAAPPPERKQRPSSGRK